MPAAVHVDGTARPQFVRREWTPRYYDVIEAFRDRTGTPAVTSFKLAGEPIVCSLEDALSTFLRRELDVHHVLERTDRDRGTGSRSSAPGRWTRSAKTRGSRLTRARDGRCPIVTCSYFIGDWTGCTLRSCRPGSTRGSYCHLS
jgi:hypothetical protein